MSKTNVVTLISAPIENVFESISNPSVFVKQVQHITNIEFLTEQKEGNGTRFIETRLMNGKEEKTELEIQDFELNKSVRMVADSHGTIWDTLFTVETINDQCKLTLEMEARAYKLLPKLINPLIKGMVKKAIEKDMLAIKEYCEEQ